MQHHDATDPRQVHPSIPLTTGRLVPAALAALLAVWVCSAPPAAAIPLESGCTSATIQDQLDSAGIAVIHGDCEADTTIYVPSRGMVTGLGTVTAGATLTGPVFDASQSERASFRDITIDAAHIAVGIYALESRDLYLDHVRVVRGRPNGVLLESARRTTIAFSDIWDSWNDGVGIRGQGEDFLDVGSLLLRNGKDPVTNGNGYDLNPGGKRARFVATVIEGSNGAGLVVEGGAAAESTQWIETDVQIVAIDSRRNRGPGLELVRKGPTAPFPHRITALGGVFADNEGPGVYAFAHGATLVGPIIVGNHSYGVTVPRLARDLTVLGAYIDGNGGAYGANAAGAYIDGSRVTFGGRQVPGAADWVTSDDALADGVQRLGVRVGPNARAVQVQGDAMPW